MVLVCIRVLLIRVYTFSQRSLGKDVVPYELTSCTVSTLFLHKRSTFLFKVDITHANRGHFYSQNDLNSTFPNK